MRNKLSYRVFEKTVAEAITETADNIQFDVVLTGAVVSSPDTVVSGVPKDIEVYHPGRILTGFALRLVNAGVYSAYHFDVNSVTLVGNVWQVNITSATGFAVVAGDRFVVDPDNSLTPALARAKLYKDDTSFSAANNPFRVADQINRGEMEVWTSEHDVDIVIRDDTSLAVLSLDLDFPVGDRLKLNPRAWGAIPGDPTIDSQPGVQRAVSYAENDATEGQEIVLEAGNFYFGDPVVVSLQNKISGAGRGTRVLPHAGWAANPSGLFHFTGANGSILYSLDLVGTNGATVATNTVTVNNCTNVMFSDMRVSTGTIGFLVENGSSRIKFTRCHIEEMSSHGVHAIDASYVDVLDCFFWDCGSLGSGAGVYVEYVAAGFTNLLVNACEFRAGGGVGRGVQIEGDATAWGNVTSAIVNNNHFYGLENEAVRLKSVRGSVVSGNVIRTCGTGVTLINSQYGVVSNNIIRNMGNTYGVLVWGEDAVNFHNVVSGNVVDFTEQSGIYVNNSDKTTLIGNIVRLSGRGVGTHYDIWVTATSYISVLVGNTFGSAEGMEIDPAAFPEIGHNMGV